MQAAVKETGFWARIQKERSGPIPGSPLNTLILCLLLAATYLGLGLFAFSMAVQNANITCQAFFPEGVSLVCIIVFGPRVAPGVFLGQFVLAQWTGLPPSVSAIVALVNSLEGILGGYLFWRWRISPKLNRPREVAMLLILCALILQPISATGGVAAQYFLFDLPAEKVSSVWLYWWAGNTLGQLLVLPVILSWISSPSALRQKKELPRALLVIGLYFIPVGIFVFGDWGENGPLYRLLTFAAFYLPLIYLAVQSRVQTVALANLLLTAPFLSLINSGPDLAIFFSHQNRHLCADIVILAGIVTSLLISSLWEQLMDRNRQLCEANAAKEKLFSVIGHDLRGPIGNLKTTLALLDDGTLSARDFKDLQNDLGKGVDQAFNAMENLMIWGRSQMSSLNPQPTRVNLREMADEAMQLLALKAEEKKITVENQIPAEATVHADVHQIQSVARNLLSNALKFTPEFGSVVFTAEREQGRWRTSVKDTGIGMSEDRAASLFKKKNEYISTLGTANERGLGLGLQICLEFVQANNGTLTVQSKPGKGTAFQVTLPAL